MSGTPEKYTHTAPLHVNRNVSGRGRRVGAVVTYRPPPGLDAVAVRAHRRPGRAAPQTPGLRRLDRAGPVLRTAGTGGRLGPRPAGRRCARARRMTVRALRCCRAAGTSRPTPGGCRPPGSSCCSRWAGVRRQTSRAPLDVVINGGVPVRLTGDAAAGLLALDDVSNAVCRRTTRQTRPSESGLPRLGVRFTYAARFDDAASPSPTWSPTAARSASGSTQRPDDAGGCPLTVDLYRTDSLIDAVVVYTPKS